MLATVTVRADAEVPTGWGSKATAPGLSPRSCAGRLTGATCPARRAPLPPFADAAADDGWAGVASFGGAGWGLGCCARGTGTTSGSGRTSTIGGAVAEL